METINDQTDWEARVNNQLADIRTIINDINNTLRAYRG